MRRVLLALLLLLLASPARAEEPEPQDAVTVKLVTFGPGGDVWNRFGHNALLVEFADGRRSLFNYGNMQFGLDLLPRYMKGQLDSWVSESIVDDDFSTYVQADRSVLIQELDLPPDADRRLVERVYRDALPQNRTYRYHHYFDNCSTRLRDLIDHALQGELKAALGGPARLGLREHTRRYASPWPLFDFTLIFWMNDRMEQPIIRWDEAFLPEELRDLVREFRFQHDGQERALLKGETLLHRSGRPDTHFTAPPLVPACLGIGVGLGLLALGLGALLGRKDLGTPGGVPQLLLGWLNAGVGAFFGALGMAGAVMWAFSDHIVTFDNENLFFANPLTLLLLPLGLLWPAGLTPGVGRAMQFVHGVLAGGAVVGTLLKALPAFDQANGPVIALLLPLNLGLFAAHVLAERRRLPGR